MPALALARHESLRRPQQRELMALEPEARILLSQLKANSLLKAAVLAELYGFDLASILGALAERPDLVRLVQEQLRYGPPQSPAPTNVRNAGFGGL